MQFLEGLSGKKKSLILAIAGIVGLLLILFGTFGEKKNENEEISKNTKENISTLEYIEHLENKIGNIAEQIIEIAQKYKSCMSKRDQRKLKSLIKRFNKVD